MKDEEIAKLKAIGGVTTKMNALNADKQALMATVVQLKDDVKHLKRVNRETGKMLKGGEGGAGTEKMFIKLEG